MHRPIPEQGAWIKQVVRGFFAYHAVPTNGAALRAFYYYVKRIWLRTLRRRSQKDRFSWQQMHSLAADWIPQPRILHPYPDKRTGNSGPPGPTGYSGHPGPTSSHLFLQPGADTPLPLKEPGKPKL